MRVRSDLNGEAIVKKKGTSKKKACAFVGGWPRHGAKKTSAGELLQRQLGYYPLRTCTLQLIYNSNLQFIKLHFSTKMCILPQSCSYGLR